MVAGEWHQDIKQWRSLARIASRKAPITHWAIVGQRFAKLLCGGRQQPLDHLKRRCRRLTVSAVPPEYFGGNRRQGLALARVEAIGPPDAVRAHTPPPITVGWVCAGAAWNSCPWGTLVNA